MTILDPNKAQRRASQMADSLQWLSYALILVFLAQVISALFPIALLQPEWMMRVSGTLLGTASLAIMALALIMLANMIDNEVMPSGQHLKLFRRIATFAAIGFLLLIPLQTYATAMGIRTQLKEGQAQLRSLVSAANLVQKASNEQQLRSAIGAIRGAEQLADLPLGADVQTIKTTLLERFRESTNLLQNQLDEAKSKALQNTILPVIRDAIVALAYAIGFAGMGYGQNGRSSPLRQLLNANKRRLSKGRQLRGQNRPGKRGRPWLKPWFRLK